MNFFSTWEVMKYQGMISKSSNNEINFKWHMRDPNCVKRVSLWTKMNSFMK